MIMMRPQVGQSTPVGKNYRTSALCFAGGNKAHAPELPRESRQFLQSIQNDPDIQKFKATAPNVYQNVCRILYKRGDFQSGLGALHQLKTHAVDYMTRHFGNVPVMHGFKQYLSCGRGSRIPNARQSQQAILTQLESLRLQAPLVWDRLHLDSLWRKAVTDPGMEALRLSNPQQYWLGILTFLQGAQILISNSLQFPELPYAGKLNEANLEDAFRQDMQHAIRQGRLQDEPLVIQLCVEQAGQEIEGYASRSSHRPLTTVSRSADNGSQIEKIDRLSRLLAFISNKLKAPDGSPLDYLKVQKQNLIKDRQYFDTDTAFLNFLQRKLKLLAFLRAELSHNQKLRSLLNQHPEVAQTLLEDSCDDALIKSNSVNDVTEVMRQELARNLNGFQWNRLRRILSAPNL